MCSTRWTVDPGRRRERRNRRSSPQANSTSTRARATSPTCPVRCAPPAAACAGADDGALHEGHLALVRAAKRVPGPVSWCRSSSTPCSSAPDEDLDAYPRTLDADLALLRAEGVEIVVRAVGRRHVSRRPAHHGSARPARRRTRRCVPGPTHFAGMLTVVLKLLQIVRPDRAFFGEKDYQQLVLVRQMVDDLERGRAGSSACPSCGKPTGWRCRRATATSTTSARAGRCAVGGAAGRHVRRVQGAAEALDAARAVLDEVPAIDVDYLEVAGPVAGPGARARGRAGSWSRRRLGTHQAAGQHRHRHRRVGGIDGHSRVESDEITNCPGGIDVTHVLKSRPVRPR